MGTWQGTVSGSCRATPRREEGHLRATQSLAAAERTRSPGRCAQLGAEVGAESEES